MSVCKDVVFTFEEETYMATSELVGNKNAGHTDNYVRIYDEDLDEVWSCCEPMSTEMAIGMFKKETKEERQRDRNHERHDRLGDQSSPPSPVTAEQVSTSRPSARNSASRFSSGRARSVLFMHRCSSAS